MRIAVLSTIVPNELKTGSEIATHAMLLGLRALGHEPTVFAYGRPFMPLRSEVPGMLLATIPVTTAEAPRAETLRWAARSLRSGLPIASEKFNYVPPGELVRRIERTGPDLLLVDHVNLYPFVRALARRMPAGIVFHDLQALSYAAVAARAARPWWRAVYRREARLNAILEAQAGREAGFAWFLSAADRDAARERLGMSGGRVIPLFYPFDTALPPPRPRFDVGLIGTWTWPPVAEGLRWFLREVLPRLPADVTVAVAGSGSEAVPAGRVERLGLVPDARAFLASCRVAAVPTVAGTGVQIKTIELAATGMPAVSTPLGTRGLDGLPPSLAVADGADAFAATLLRLVEAERARPGSSAAGGAAWNAERRRAAEAAMAADLAAVAAT